MKKISLVATVFIAVFSMLSCDNVEPIDSTLIGEVDSNNPGGGNSGGPGSNTLDYWPTAINNIWHLEQNGTPVDPLKIIGTGTFNGRLYYKFAPQSGSGTSSSGTVTTWLNKNNGVYYLKTDDIVINAGGMTGTQTGYEQIALIDNLNVGGTWNGTYSQTTSFSGFPAVTMNTTYTGTILAKDVTEVVEGETFNNVIKVRINQTSTSFGLPTTELTYELWYAKGVGPIKTITTSTGVNIVTNLVDYTLF